MCRSRCQLRHIVAPLPHLDAVAKLAPNATLKALAPALRPRLCLALRHLRWRWLATIVQPRLALIAVLALKDHLDHAFVLPPRGGRDCPPMARFATKLPSTPPGPARKRPTLRRTPDPRLRSGPGATRTHRASPPW